MQLRRAHYSSGQVISRERIALAKNAADAGHCGTGGLYTMHMVTRGKGSGGRPRRYNGAANAASAPNWERHLNQPKPEPNRMSGLRHTWVISD